jgi:MinD-like ATPase involved in chromosome partitioning or flagellar assembly
MLDVLLATGFENLDNSLLKRFNSDDHINLIKKAVYHREGVVGSIELTNADVVIISDYLEGNSLTQGQLIKLIRKKNPKVRIIYIIKDEENVELKKFLFSLGIWNVISLLPQLNTKTLHHLITVGNKWEDVSEFFTDFDPSMNFKIDEDFIFSNKSIPEYSSFGAKSKRNPELLSNNFNAFWSPRSQSGSTTLVSNAAILLAQREDERILVIDFNLSNPNLHLSLGVEDYDGDHNLSALCEDIAEKTFRNVSDLSNYLLFHNSYKNITVLPGLILKYETPSDEILLESINIIFEYAKKENFSSIIFDMDNDLNMNCNIELLRKVSKIIMPLTERPGTVINLQKVFDAVYGPFFLNMLNINKVYPILNVTSNTLETKKISQIIENVLKRNIYSEIPYLKEIAISNNEGIPYLKNKPEITIFREFIKLTNCVHDVFAVPPVTDTKRIGLFNKKR